MAAETPRPPRLHWLIVLVLGVATVGIFLDIWLIVQAVWVKKFDRASRALVLCVAGIVLGILGALLGQLQAPHAIEYPVDIASLIIGVVASFQVRDSLGEYITSVKSRPTYLSGVMTLFFGPIYLQYHMNKVRSFQNHLSAAHAR